MPTLLAIDTSSPRCTVALYSEERVTSRSVEVGRQNAQLVLPLLAEVLAAAGMNLQQMDVIAVMAGPGSFTGIRIGVGVAQGLGMANDTRILPLSNLAVKAFTALRQTGATRVLVSEKAKDDEVYFAAYQQCTEAGVVLQGTEQVCAAADILIDPVFAVSPKDWVAAGSGWQDPTAIQQRLGVSIAGLPIDPTFDCSDFCELARLRLLRGEAVSAEQALPNYVKDTLNYKR